MFKKSAAFSIGIPRNGRSTSRAPSPDTMQIAFAETASSRNLLSLGSRQSKIVSLISKKIVRRSKSDIIRSPVSREIYLSNFGRRKTSENSLKVATLDIILPTRLAFVSARRGWKFFEIDELISVFVSNTKRLFFIQQFFKNFFCKPIPRSFITSFIKKCLKIGYLNLIRNFIEQILEFFTQSFFYLRRSLIPFFGSISINVNCNLWHVACISIPLKITKNIPINPYTNV